MNHGTVAGNAQAYGLRFSQPSVIFATRVVIEHEKLAHMIRDTVANMGPSTHLDSNGKLRGLVDLGVERVQILVQFIDQHRRTYGEDADSDRIQRILEIVERLDAAIDLAKEASAHQPFANSHRSPSALSPARRAESMGVAWDPSAHRRRSAAQQHQDLSPPIGGLSPDPPRGRLGGPSHGGPAAGQRRGTGFLRDPLDDTLGRPSVAPSHYSEPPIRAGAPHRDDSQPVGRLQRTPPRARARSPELTLDDEPLPTRGGGGGGRYGDEEPRRAAHDMDEVPVGGGGGGGPRSGGFDEQPIGRRGAALRDSAPAASRDENVRPPQRATGPPAAKPPVKTASKVPGGIRARLEARSKGVQPTAAASAVGNTEPEISVAAPARRPGGPRAAAPDRSHDDTPLPAIAAPPPHHDDDDDVRVVAVASQPAEAVAPAGRRSPPLRRGGAVARSDYGSESMPAPSSFGGAGTAGSSARIGGGAYGGGGASGPLVDLMLREEAGRQKVALAAFDALFAIFQQSVHQGALYLRDIDRSRRGEVVRQGRRTVNASQSEYQTWSFVVIAPFVALAAAFLLLPVYNTFRRLTGDAAL